jgi:hypothetical protein
VVFRGSSDGGTVNVPSPRVSTHYVSAMLLLPTYHVKVLDFGGLHLCNGHINFSQNSYSDSRLKHGEQPIHAFFRVCERMCKQVFGGLVRCRLLCQYLLLWVAENYKRIRGGQPKPDQGF